MRETDAIPAIRGLLRAPGALIAASIADSGIGIPADKLDQIFEPFFTTKEVGKPRREAQSMVIEKVHAAVEAMTTLMLGGSAATIIERYRELVGANIDRLSAR